MLDQIAEIVFSIGLFIIYGSITGLIFGIMYDSFLKPQLEWNAYNEVRNYYEFKAIKSYYKNAQK